jgi:hypothetical protein
MKKITLSIIMTCVLSLVSYSQVYTSGLVNVENATFPGVTINSVQIDIDVTNNLVTATVIGPDNSWLGFGFDSVSMSEDKDIIMFDGTVLTDRTFQGLGVTPSIDTEENWTLISNTTDLGLRTIVATRARIAVDATDYTFPSDQSPFDIVSAHGNDEFTLNYHEFENRGSERLSFVTLSANSFEINNFSIAPNPARNSLSVVLPSTIQKSTVSIYDVLGKKVFSAQWYNTHTTSIAVSAWQDGVYLVRVSNAASTLTRRFVKN